MKKLALATLAPVGLAAALIGGTAYAQPRDNHRGPPPSHDQQAAPNAMRGPGARPPGVGPGRNSLAPSQGFGGARRLPPGVHPGPHHSAPMWHGRSFRIGDIFILNGFHGPVISDWAGYRLERPRPGTHWIYVDGWYLMVGNRTGHIFAEVSAY